ITFFMLPRQLTLPPKPPAELNPSPSHSCKLFCASEKVNSRKISNFRTLSPKHPGWGVHPHHPVHLAPAIACATQRLYPLRPQPVAHTSRRHSGVLSPSFSLRSSDSSVRPQVSSPQALAASFHF